MCLRGVEAIGVSFILRVAAWSQMSGRRINICIVSHNAYGAIKGGKFGHAGGVEFQTSLLAKWLAKRGHKVSFITWNEGGPKEEDIDGVRVIKLCKMEEGIPGLRFFYPRWSSLVWALKKANAEIYYHNLGEYVTGQIALWARLRKKRFVYYVANDDECICPPLYEGRIYDRIFFILGLRLSDLILSQTYRQKELLERNYGLKSDVMRMPCTYSVNNSEICSYSQRENRILWVGRIAKQKRLEWLLDIAKDLPQFKFDVVGKYDQDDPYGKRLARKMDEIENVVYHGMVAHHKLPQFYKHSLLLCNTSVYEGFPNTFVEAWGYGLPVVSTFDTDSIIKTNNLGFFVSSKEDIIRAIKKLQNAPETWANCSINARSYYLENHFPEKALENFEKNFLQLMEIEPVP